MVWRGNFLSGKDWSDNISKRRLAWRRKAWYTCVLFGTEVVLLAGMCFLDLFLLAGERESRGQVVVAAVLRGLWRSRGFQSWCPGSLLSMPTSPHWERECPQ